jgi:hypothetical protein
MYLCMPVTDLDQWTVKLGPELPPVSTTGSTVAGRVKFHGDGARWVYMYDFYRCHLPREGKK